MAANSRLSKLGGGRAGQALNGRRAPLIVAAVSAVLAAALIYVYVSHQSKSTPVAVAPQQATVFVATSYIPAGTAGAQIAADGLLKRETIPQSETIPGAIYDPSQVTAGTSTEAIAAGQQVTTTEFNAAAKPTIPSALKGDNRGVAFALGAPQALGTTLAAGDYVDVMLLFKPPSNTSELIASNVEVLANSGGQVFLRLTDKQALLLTAATNKGTLWLDYRPFHGATHLMKVGDEETIK